MKMDDKFDKWTRHYKSGPDIVNLDETIETLDEMI